MFVTVKNYKILLKWFFLVCKKLAIKLFIYIHIKEHINALTGIVTSVPLKQCTVLLQLEE